jgi:hypothetical protein
MTQRRNTAEQWFIRVLWLGIVANLGLALPTLLMTERVMAMSNLPAASPLLWPRFAALLLILLSAFYMPAGLDPNRYRLVAWLAVGSRLAGVIFFVLFQAREYHVLGYFDLAFFVPELVLLLLMTMAPAALADPAVRPVPIGRGAVR